MQEGREQRQKYLGPLLSSFSSIVGLLLAIAMGGTQLPYSFMNDRETPSIVKVRKFMDSICSDHIGHPFDLVQGPGLERMQRWWRKGRCHLTN